jgi:hypothetical protein
VQTELDKLDAIRSRMNVSYEDARTALESADGNVVQALVNIEKGKGDLLSVGIELMDDIQKLLEARAVNKLRIKFGDKVLAEYPVALTAAAAVFVGLAAILVSKSTIEVEQEKEEPEEEE